MLETWTIVGGAIAAVPVVAFRIKEELLDRNIRNSRTRARAISGSWSTENGMRTPVQQHRDRKDEDHGRRVIFTENTHEQQPPRGLIRFEANGGLPFTI